MLDKTLEDTGADFQLVLYRNNQRREILELLMKIVMKN